MLPTASSSAATAHIATSHWVIGICSLAPAIGAILLLVMWRSVDMNGACNEWDMRCDLLIYINRVELTVEQVLPNTTVPMTSIQIVYNCSVDDVVANLTTTMTTTIREWGGWMIRPDRDDCFSPLLQTRASCTVCSTSRFAVFDPTVLVPDLERINDTLSGLYRVGQIQDMRLETAGGGSYFNSGLCPLSCTPTMQVQDPFASLRATVFVLWIVFVILASVLVCVSVGLYKYNIASDYLELFCLPNQISILHRHQQEWETIISKAFLFFFMFCSAKHTHKINTNGCLSVLPTRTWARPSLIV
jgi:hypothetical protein